MCPSLGAVPSLGQRCAVTAGGCNVTNARVSGLRTETVLMVLEDEPTKTVSPVWFFILLAVAVLVLVFLILG
jgi:hypothetical protein